MSSSKRYWNIKISYLKHVLKNKTMTLPWQHLLASNYKQKDKNMMWNIFRFTDKDTRATALTSLLCLYY